MYNYSWVRAALLCHFGLPMELWLSSVMIRAVVKSQGLGISPGYYECSPRLLLLENRGKIELKEIPNCLIPCLLVVFTWQLKILVTTLDDDDSKCIWTCRWWTFSATVEPQYKEPLYNEVLSIKNDFLFPSNSKIYEKEPWLNETSL